jgi:hypothetical protein
MSAQQKQAVYHILGQGYRELKSDYLGVSSYFYKQGQIIELNNLTLQILIPDYNVISHLKKLNNIP